MDVVNTFKWNVGFTPSPLTRVLREHKDRFVTKTYETYYEGFEDEYDSEHDSITFYIYMGEGNLTTGVDIETEVVEYSGFTLSGGGEITSDLYYNHVQERSYVYVKFQFISTHEGPFYCKVKVSQEGKARQIDLYSEGINPVLYKKELGQLLEDSNKWYLIYDKGHDEVVNCYLAPKYSLDMLVTNSTILSSASFDEGKVYLFSDYYQGSVEYSIRTDNKNWRIHSYWYTPNLWWCYTLEVVITAGDLVVYYYKYVYDKGC